MMTILNLLLDLHSVCHFRSTEGKSELSKGELKRWCSLGSVLINGERVNWDEPFDFPVFSMVLHPKGVKRTTLL